MIEIVRIPADRKAAFIGKGGRVKARIEKATQTDIEVSEDVRIMGDDPILFLKAKDIVIAIGRGFSPKQAERLLDEDCYLHVISLDGKCPKKRERLLGRVIGREGRSKETIEEETGASICIRGKTLALIGTPEELEPAEEAIDKLLAGKTHAYAYQRMFKRKASR